MTIQGNLARFVEQNKKHHDTLANPLKMADLSPYARENGQGVIVILCSDPRLNPYRIFGLDDKNQELQAVFIRNAGGRALDAERSLAALGNIGNPATIVVMHHADCGMTHFNDAAVKEHLYEISPESGEAIEAIETYGQMLGPIEDSIKYDAEYLSKSPFIKKGTAVVGLKYSTFTGEIWEICSYTR